MNPGSARASGFMLREGDIRNDILIPRYYDPRISDRLEQLGATHQLMSLRSLVSGGAITHSHGDYVPKIHYGTGPYPYVRTSDVANWEIKASPKHGIPHSVYLEYSDEQRVEPEDILFVHEGTYLIGATAMVTRFDGPMVYQHHLAKFKVNAGSPFGPYFLLCALESPEVHDQIRARQFSADIIDSVVGRLEEILIPVPNDKLRLQSIEALAERLVVGRAEIREQLSQIVHGLDLWLRGTSSETLYGVLNSRPSSASSTRAPALLGGKVGFSAKLVRARDIRKDVLLPKYYDDLSFDSDGEYQDCDLKSIGELKQAGILSWQTGDEIGRLNYGTGDVPFVRTSDFGSWELKREAKQGVSGAVLAAWQKKQGAEAGDILLVRDGTYLVGTSVLLHEADLPLLYCGGIIKIRASDPVRYPAELLFALLNTPSARKQIKNKQFTRDVIDTLGNRLDEVKLPIPRSPEVRLQISTGIGSLLKRRSDLRHELHALTAKLYAAK